MNDGNTLVTSILPKNFKMFADINKPAYNIEDSQETKIEILKKN